MEDYVLGNTLGALCLFVWCFIGSIVVVYVRKSYQEQTDWLDQNIPFVSLLLALAFMISWPVFLAFTWFDKKFLND